MATPEEQITPADAAIVTTGTGRKGPEEHDLPESLKAKLKEFFLNYSDASYFEEVHGEPSIRFIDVSEEDYKVVYDTLEALHIEGE